MKKLLLIHPATRSASAGFAQSGAWHMPPLALGYVAALTPEHWDARIVDEYVEPVNTDEAADLVGITSYTANATRAYEISRQFRRRRIPVVMGGIHASMLPDEAAQHADAVVVGEAEPIWNKVVSDFEKGALQRKYFGELMPMENWPIPRRDLFSSKYQMDVIQTTRGCPFSCEFCSVTAFNHGQHRERPVEEVLREMETLKQDIVYIIDDNILGAGRAAEERLLTLFNAMIERTLIKPWCTQASINIADNERLLKYAQKSGCRAIYIGVESVLPENLKQMKKGVNLKVGIAGFRERIKRIHDHGIAVIGSFILGHDHDDVSTPGKILKFMDEARIDVFQISYLTPFPGTKLFERLSDEGRILYKNFPEDWDYCDSDNIMFVPRKISMVELVHGFDYIVRQRLQRPRIELQFLKTLVNTGSLVSAMIAYNLNKGAWTGLNPDKAIITAKESAHGACAPSAT